MKDEPSGSLSSTAIDAIVRELRGIFDPPATAVLWDTDGTPTVLSSLRPGRAGVVYYSVG